MPNIAQEGSPGGWGGVRKGGGGSPPPPPIQTGIGGEGIYTDPTGKQISREEAIKTGLISAPGSTGEILRGIGASLPGATTKAEQRLGIEEALRKGQITQAEALQLTKQNIEGRQLQLVRQQQEQQKAQQQIIDQQARQEFLKSAGLIIPEVQRVQQGLTPKDFTKYTSEADIRYVTIAGKSRLFVPQEMIRRETPITPIQKSLEEKNVELSNIIKYKTPASVVNFIDAIDKRAQLSFQGQKPLNPFALKNVAEAVYGIEKGMVKGVVEEPITAITSLAVGGVLSKGAGVLAARVPALSKTIVPELKTVSNGQKISLYRAMFGAPKGVPITEPLISTELPSIGIGKALKPITEKLTPINIVSGVMAGYYGADVASRIAASNKKYEELGKILSTEILPMAAGAKIATMKLPTFPSISSSLKQTRAKLIETYGKDYIKAIETRPILEEYKTKDLTEDEFRALIEKGRKIIDYDIEGKRIIKKEPIIDKTFIRQGIRTGLKPKTFLQEYQTGELTPDEFNAIIAKGKAEYAIDIEGKRIKITEPTMKDLADIKLISTPSTREIINSHTSSLNQVKKIIRPTAPIETYKKSIGKGQRTIQIQRQKVETKQEVKVGKGQKQILIQKEKVKTIQKTKKPYQLVYISAANRLMSQLENQADKIRGDYQKQESIEKQKQKQIEKQITRPLTKQLQGFTPSSLNKSIQTFKQIERSTSKEAIKEVSRERQVSKQIFKPIEEKKILLAPKDFKEKLNNYSKGRKRRGKYVWNIKNPIPTLKSLTG